MNYTPCLWLGFLLNGVSRYSKKQLNLHVRYFLLFPNYLNVSSDTLEIHRKLCSSLCKVTKILIPQYEERVRKYCFPDLDNSAIIHEMNDLIVCFKGRGKFDVRSRGKIMEYYIPLGRSYGFGQYNGKINRYGGCYVSAYNSQIDYGGIILKFYLNYERRVGLKRLPVAEYKYYTVFTFLGLVLEMQVKTNWKNYDKTCQSIKNSFERYFKTMMELNMQHEIDVFQEEFLLFVDNYCDSLHTLNWTKLYVMICTWYMNIMDVECLFHQHIEELIDELLLATGLYHERTNEITEMLIEIIAATVYVLTNDNFEAGIELIPSGRAEETSKVGLTGLSNFAIHRNFMGTFLSVT